MRMWNIAGTLLLVAAIGVSYHVALAQTAPPAPANIFATTKECGTGQIDVVWATVAAANYKLYRNGTLITSLYPSWYTDGGLTAGATYTYSVLAYNAYGESGSVSTTATAPAACETTPDPPSPPASLTATTGPCGTTEIGLYWSESLGATFYELYRDNTLIYGGTNNSYPDNSVAAGSVHTYKVLARNAGGDSAFTTTSGTAPSACTLKPAAPGPLTATPQACGTGKIDLTWVAVTGATSYTLYRGSTQIYAGPAIGYTDTGLAAGTQYSYSAKASNAYGDSPSVTASATSPGVCPPPTPPTGFTATPGACESGTIHLSWNAVSGANGYNLKHGSSVDYAGPATSRSVSGLTAGTSYTFELNAFSNTGQSSYVTATAVAPGACPPPPPTPATLTATPGVCDSHTVTLAWAASTGATGYSLSRDNTVVYTGTALAFTDTSTADATWYTYKVSAFNAGGTSTAKTASVSSPIACNSVPAAPTGMGLSSLPTPSSVSLEWIDNATNETHFIIERKLLGGTYSLLKQLNSANATTYTDTSVVPDTVYGYRVQACRTGAGCSDYSTIGIVKVPAVVPEETASPPPTPSSFSASTGACGTNSVTLDWGTVSGAENYKVYRNNTLIHTTTERTYTDSALAPATQYTYALRAVNADGTSDPKTIYVTTPAQCATTTAPPVVVTTVSENALDTSNTVVEAEVPPAPPTQLRQSDASADGIRLEWKDNSSDEDSFVIERRRDSAASYSLLKRLPANATSFLDTNVSADSRYAYRLRACRKDSCSSSALLSDVRFRTPSAVTTAILESIAPERRSVTPAAGDTAADTAPLSRIVESSGPVLTRPLRVLRQQTPAGGTNASDSRQESRNAPVVRTSEAVQRLERINTVVNDVRLSLEKTKRELKNAVDQRISNALAQAAPEDVPALEAPLLEIRQQIEDAIEASLGASIVADPKRISALSHDIGKGLAKIDALATGAAPAPESMAAPVSEALAALSEVVEERATELKASGGDLVYKDSNNDGISDYDSVHVYDLDPLKPSPVTIINGKELKAGEKVLLGLDPKQSAPVQIQHEEAKGALAPITEIYKVDEVKLTEEKKVALKGKALPNSFVTLYIYSTPIIVTVKTNADGEWEYTMDKELETGDHVVYSATVNETGKIVARSNPILFTKTAEAATLDTVPPIGVSQTQRQDIFSNPAVMPLIVLSALFIIGVLFVIGRDHTDKKKEEDAQTA